MGGQKPVYDRDGKRPNAGLGVAVDACYKICPSGRVSD